MRLLNRGVLYGAVTLVVSGCGDLAGKPDQVPGTLEITPGDTLITEGDAVRFSVAVYDRNGEPMPGPPSWTPPEWLTFAPEAVELSQEGEAVGLKGAAATIVARAAGVEGTTRLRVNPSSVLIDVPAFYFNQVNQNTDGSVPILADRQALLRVFVTGDQASFYEPGVRADFYLDGEVTHSAVMAAPVEMVPRRIDEGDLMNSYNAVIPGHVLQPGVEMVIEVDPEDKVPMSAGSRARIPESGGLPLDIVELKNHHQVLVPTVRNSNPNEVVAHGWGAGVTTETGHILLLRNYLPIADITVEGHETLFTDANLRTSAGWAQYVREIWSLWQTEGQKGYYYGVVKRFGGAYIGGRAYAIGWPPVSVGLDIPETFVHEIGHSMNLRHAPCGGAGGPDPNYPYPNGGIGMWGYDFARGALVDPGSSTRDFMSYCDPTWISDYHFGRAMRYRERSEGGPPPGPAEQTLLLWGSMSWEGVRLDPAFLIESPPTAPPTGGPYRLEGFGPAGEVRFSFDFAPVLLGTGGAHFLFTLPYDPGRDGTLERIVLSGPEGEDTLSPGSTPPMAILRDGPGGTIRAFLRDWDGTVPSGVQGGAVPVRVLLSDGIPGGVR